MTAAGGRGLGGRRVLVLRPEGQAAGLAALLAAEGAEPVVVPAVRILPPEDWGPVDALAADLARLDWVVFTSVNGVTSVLDRLGGLAGFRGRTAAVGPATAGALERGGVAVDWIPPAYTTASLAAGLPGPPGRVCVLRAAGAGPELEEVLGSRGFDVERVDAYRTEPAGGGGIAEALRTGVDAVALTSASIVRAVVSATAGNLGGAAAFSIGPATSAACREMGIAVACEAAPHTAEGLVACMAERLGARS